MRGVEDGVKWDRVEYIRRVMICAYIYRSDLKKKHEKVNPEIKKLLSIFREHREQEEKRAISYSKSAFGRREIHTRTHTSRHLTYLVDIPYDRTISTHHA